MTEVSHYSFREKAPCRCCSIAGEPDPLSCVFHLRRGGGSWLAQAEIPKHRSQYWRIVSSLFLTQILGFLKEANKPNPTIDVCWYVTSTNKSLLSNSPHETVNWVIEDT
eukprot:GFUD01110648.1.p1 GENE.GFUD01110648.1~~GFUD01110648.1.p1  ORF type:complete len:109 (+),score=11.33 GFUD01110648.1:123-449(+)